VRLTTNLHPDADSARSHIVEVAMYDRIPPDWKTALGGTPSIASLAAIDAFVADRRRHGPVYPAARDVYAALHLTPLASIRAVIVGQDPYHGKRQAHGLAFSVRPPALPPPSLRSRAPTGRRRCCGNKGIGHSSLRQLSDWSRERVQWLWRTARREPEGLDTSWRHRRKLCRRPIGPSKEG
jgi:hypothetical protein